MPERPVSTSIRQAKKGNNMRTAAALSCFGDYVIEFAIDLTTRMASRADGWLL